MSGPAGDAFPQFLRTFVSPVLKARGYTQAGRTYQRTQGPVTARLIFMRYTGAHSGRFDVRMRLTLDPVEQKLGAVVLDDLSRRVYGSVANAPWVWPCEQWPALVDTLLGSLTPGAEWIESLLPLPALASHLEAQRRWTPDADLDRLRIAHAMASSGIETASQSAGDASPRAGTIRPDKVAALSYCYELIEDWEKAADAWRDYMATMGDSSTADDPRARKAQERSLFLEGRCRGD